MIENKCVQSRLLCATTFSAFVFQVTNNFGASSVVQSANGNWNPKLKPFVIPHGGTTQGQVKSMAF